MENSIENNPLNQLVVHGDVKSIGVRWEKWKRSFLIYIEAFNVKSAKVQKARLLHFAGADVQEIFYTLPELSDDVSGRNEFDEALLKLDKYFEPRQSKIFERHLFRQIVQGKNEKFEKFLVRLRQQGSKCKFGDNEEHIIDQIVEKCFSDKLRRKILEMDDSKALVDIIMVANSLEAVEIQMKQFEDKEDQNVCAVNSRRTCNRCGAKDHDEHSKACPALDKKCNKCGYVGHFAFKCNTKTGSNNRFGNRTNFQRFPPSKRFKKENIRSLEDTAEHSTSQEYIFHIDGENEITCRIGNVNVRMIIDSGCRLNIVDDMTWEMLKTKKVKVTNQKAGPLKEFFAYGSQVPLKNIGSFESQIRSPTGKLVNATFYVIEGGKQCLLGRETSENLGVLKILNNVNAIGASRQVFSKFKDIVVDIPIKLEVRPVVQPYRHIPIPLEHKVNEKLKELVSLDIIERVERSSSWVSAMVPILKKNNEVRICIDMRQANKAIEREHYPLPTIESILPHLRNAKLFSRLDIENAFHQIEISERSRYITTFITKSGLYRYKRLNFGICCAPEMFQKIMESMLVECEGCVNFIDDIIVYGDSVEKHDENLQFVKAVLKSNGVKLNEDKCCYAVNKLEFLGYELSSSGIRPSKTKIETVQNFRRPTSSEEVQSFLGLVNFVGCRFLPNLATV